MHHTLRMDHIQALHQTPKIPPQDLPMALDLQAAAPMLGTAISKLDLERNPLAGHHHIECVVRFGRLQHRHEQIVGAWTRTQTLRVSHLAAPQVAEIGIDRSTGLLPILEDNSRPVAQPTTTDQGRPPRSGVG